MNSRKQIFNSSSMKSRRRDLRVRSTLTEKIMWEKLRRNRLGYKFFRQYSIEGYVLDFYCPEKHIGIELDGSVHMLDEVIKYDVYRQKYLEAFGINIIRFCNNQVLTDASDCVRSIISGLHTPS